MSKLGLGILPSSNLMINTVCLIALLFFWIRILHILCIGLLYEFDVNMSRV